MPDLTGICPQILGSEEPDRVLDPDGLPHEKGLAEFRADTGAIVPGPGLDGVQEFGPADERLFCSGFGPAGAVELGFIGPDRLHFLLVRVGDVDDERRA